MVASAGSVQRLSCAARGSACLCPVCRIARAESAVPTAVAKPVGRVMRRQSVLQPDSVSVSPIAMARRVAKMAVMECAAPVRRAINASRTVALLMIASRNVVRNCVGGTGAGGSVGSVRSMKCAPRMGSVYAFRIAGPRSAAPMAVVLIAGRVRRDFNVRATNACQEPVSRNARARPAAPMAVVAIVAHARACTCVRRKAFAYVSPPAAA